MVSPGEFIPVAQESELMMQISDWTLREACRQIQEWRFTVRILQAIARSGIRRGLMIPELTESRVISDAERVAEGVETEAQRDFLATLNCTRYQGYPFSRPLPAEEFTEKWLLASM